MGEFCICNKPGARRTRYPPIPSSINAGSAEQKYIPPRESGECRLVFDGEGVGRRSPMENNISRADYVIII